MLSGRPAAISPEILSEIVALLADGRREEARELERRVIERVARETGTASEAYADVQDALLQARLEAGLRDATTLRIAERAVALRLTLESAPTPELLRSLRQLAYLLHVDGDLVTARDFYLSLLELQRSDRGPDSDEALSTQAELGNLETDLGDLIADLALIESGKGRMLEAVAASEGRHGRHHPQPATLRRYLALRLFAEERFVEALEIYRTNLRTHELARPVDDKALARSHHNLGEVWHRLGDVEASRYHLDRALESRLSRRSRFAANTYSSLGDLDFNVGDLVRAREHYELALAGQLEQWGEDPYRYAETLSRLASLLEVMGDWDGALDRQQKAARIRSEKLGADDPRTARSQQRLGALRLQLGDLEGAGAALERALAVQETRLGPGHSDLVATLVTTALLRQRRGEDRAAIELLERALAGLDFVARVNPESRRRAERIEPLYLLARLLRRRGETSRAAQLADEADELAVSIFGPDSTSRAPTLAERAAVHLASDAWAQAIDSALEAEAIRRRHVRSTIQSFPESQAIAFTEIAATSLDTALAALRRAGAGASAQQVEAVWDAVVDSRALVLEAVASRQRLLRDSRDARLAQLAFEVAEARSRVAALTLRRPGELPFGVHRQLLDDSRARLAQTERMLAAASAASRDPDPGRTRLGRVLAELPRQDALLAVVSYRVVEDGGPASPPHEATFYGAFAHRPGSGTVWRDLGTAVDQAVREWRRAKTETEVNAVGERLRRLIWDPVSGALAGARTVYLVPAGATLLVDFAALPDSNGGYLIENGPTLHYLTSERELLQNATGRPSGAGLLAVGDVDYQRSEEVVAAGDELEEGSARDRGGSSCRSFDQLRFERLPATGEEIERVADMWRRGQAGRGVTAAVQPLTGSAATESRFKELAPGKAVLHVATHGFFLQGGCRREGDSSLGSAAARSLLDPLALSGVVLAGANAGRQATSGANDGILTALEVMSLDLSGVEWAVLSACDTGRGEIHSSEGVLGLRRALAVAGARTVVMSLWPVDDRTTADWMALLYELRFLEGHSTAEAVRSASLRLLRQRREAGLDTHPIRWSGFIASGDWR